MSEMINLENYDYVAGFNIKLAKALFFGTPSETALACGECRTEPTSFLLGIACRYRGLGYVKAMVENGARFQLDLEVSFDHSINELNLNDYLLLLDIKWKGVHYYIDNWISDNINIEDTERGIKVSYPLLPLEERLEVLDYLIENSADANFDPTELLYYSIMLGDKQMTDALEKRGVGLSDYRKEIIIKGNCSSAVWNNWLELLGSKKFNFIVSKLAEHLDGKKLRWTRGVFFSCEKFLNSVENIKLYFEVFDDPKIVNKEELFKRYIKNDNVDCLSLFIELGFLRQPDMRDRLIEFAQKNGKVESTAVLLDFKNRKFDVAAERERARKKEERLLNAEPNSITAMKTLWGWKKLESGGLILTNYKGDSTEIIVPRTIGKNTVTALGMAFSPAARAISSEAGDFRKTIKHVTLPDSITEIAPDAFRVCTALESVDIPDSVTKIGEGAFYCCRSLERIDIPNGVREIEALTFSYCDLLKDVTLPDSVKKIGDTAFCGCSALENITLPRDLTEIEPSAFEECRSLRSIKLPPSLKIIQADSFGRCVKLSAVEIPNGVEVIGESAFYSCVKLCKLSLPDTLKRIGDCAFQGCVSLKNVVIPEGVVELGEVAFGDCKDLCRVELPRSLTKIKTVPSSRIIDVNIWTNGLKGGGDHDIPDPETPFYGTSKDFKAVVYRDSYAEKYCKRYKIPFIYKEENA